MAKRYFWLKLKDDFFSSIKIKKLRKITDGNLLTIIYLKMQLLSVRNGGVLRFEGVENSLEEELALVLDEEIEPVRLTIQYLKEQGMLEQVDDHQFLLTDTASNIGSESESTARVRNLRYKHNKELLHSDDSVTPDKDIDKDKDADKDINKEGEQHPLEKKKLSEKEQTFKNINLCSDGQSSALTVSYQQVQKLYNDICTRLPKCQSLSSNCKQAIKAGICAGKKMEDFKLLFEKAEASRFLRGENPRGWQANFDWLIKESNMVKVLEGMYDNQSERGNNYGYNTYPQAARPDIAGGFEEISGGLRL